MDKTFDEAIAGIRKAERGVEVREDIAQGMEYVKQYAEEVTGQQQAALQAAQTAAGAASTATKKAAAAAESESTARTSAAEAAQSAQSASADAKSAESSAASAEESANRAAAIVSTDKTLSVEGAPADAKAVGDALKGIKLPIATATTLGGVKVGSGLTVDADGTLSADSALAAYPVGSIFQTVGNTSPAALFGGTWQEIAFNRVLMGAGNAYAAGTTVEAGLPNITGSLREANADSSPFRGSKASLKSSGALKFVEINTSWGGYRGDSGSTYDVYFDASRSNSIYGRSATVQPAAYYVHIWRRVA
nr:MAG TPA: baseplate protein [Caudoviricetes sp.]